MKMFFANMWLFGSLIKKRMFATAATAASFRTTTAPTMFSGSPQDNVLPMRATAVINFRILQGDTIQSLTDRVTRLIADPRVKIKPLSGDISEPSRVAPLTAKRLASSTALSGKCLGDSPCHPLTGAGQNRYSLLYGYCRLLLSLCTGKAARRGAQLPYTASMSAFR